MLQDNHDAKAAAPSRLPGRHVYFSTAAADWSLCAGGGAPRRRKWRPCVPVLRWRGRAFWRPWRVRAAPRCWPPCRAAGQCLPPPRVLSACPVRTAGSVAQLSAAVAGRAPFVAMRGRNGFAAPRGPGRKGRWAGASLSSRSGLCVPAPSPHAGGTLAAVPAVTGRAARPGRFAGPARGVRPGSSAGLPGPVGAARRPRGGRSRRSRSQHGAPVLPVLPAFLGTPPRSVRSLAQGLYTAAVLLMRV